MKIKSATLINIAKYDQITVNFDDNITYLIGKNGSGKSTIGITAIWFVMQGIAEKASGGNTPLIGERFRFIGPKSATGKGELVLYDEERNVEIIVRRKLTKSGSELSFEAPEDYGDLNQQWLNDLFNIFLIAPKKFTELSPVDQARALGIDTTKFDEAIKRLKIEYTDMNRDIKNFGELREVIRVERVDLSELQKRKDELKTKWNELYQINKRTNGRMKSFWEDKKAAIDNEVKEFNDNQASLTLKYNACFDAHYILKDHGYDGSEVEKFIGTIKEQMQPQILSASDRYPAEPEYIPEMPDSSEIDNIDQRILDASNTNERAFAYDQYNLRRLQKEALEADLSANKHLQNAEEIDRLNYIKSFKFPFSNLSVSDDGQLLLENKPIKEPYFSTGELLKIVPILMASVKPELKYVFIQDWQDLDQDNQLQLEKYLTDRGFQLVVEIVGKEKITSKNCILLKDNCVVENYDMPMHEVLTV